MTNHQRERRSSSISEYSSLFRGAAPQTNTLLHASRHPSLSLGRDSVSARLGFAIPQVMNLTNESAIADDVPLTLIANSDLSTNASITDDPIDTTRNRKTNIERRSPQRSMTDETQPNLGRRLSLGARAIMFSGQNARMRSENSSSREAVNAPTGQLVRSAASHARTVSESSSSNEMAVNDPTQGTLTPYANASEAGKQIKRRLSPTGERMLRGDLAFH